MSNLSELLPAGAGAKSADFVASGTLGSGVTVALKSNGQVEAVSGVAQAVGSPVVFESGTSQYVSSTFDSANNKVVIAYRNETNSDYGTAVVGTISGTSISFGTPVVFASSNSVYESITYDSINGKVVIAYANNSSSSRGTAIVGTVSGTSISFGSATVFESTDSSYISATYDSTNEKIVIAYRDYANSEYGTAIVGTVSGTSISFGSAVVFESAATYYISATYDSTNNKIVIAYNDGGNSSYGTAIVGTVSGTSISFGTAVVFENATSQYMSAVFDSNANKVVIAYRDNGNSFYGTAIVGTVSGTSISFGTAVVFNTANATEFGTTFDSTNNKVVIAYSDFGNSGNGTLITGTVSGTSISFDSALVYEAAQVTYSSAIFDSNANKVAIAYQDVGNSSYGTSVVLTVGSSNNTDFIGITDEAIANTATGAVIVQGGVNGKVTGLTIGADYYVQADGSLGSPTASLLYDISGATYASKSFGVGGQDGLPWDIAFNTNASKLYVLGGTNDTVYQYTLSTPGDISTASYDSVSFSVGSQEGAATGLAFNTDGTKMYIVGGNSTVYQYTVASGFNLSSVSYDSVSFSVSSQETTVRSVRFNTDGTSMYIIGTATDSIFQYTLSSGFNLATASYASKSFAFTSQTSDVRDAVFNDTGSKMFMLDGTNDKIQQYSLSSLFDVSTASYSSIEFSVASQDPNPVSFIFGPDGTKFYYGGNDNDTIYQYSTGVGSVTTVPAGRALSSTSILLEG